MIAIRGAGSRIVSQLVPLLPSDEIPRCVGRQERMPTDAERYLFCSGLLRAKSVDEQTPTEIEEGNRVNLWQVTDDCERILSLNDKARICVIGSESAYRGSYDGVYARAKRSLHEYVESKALKPDQQLVCISPDPIEDAGQHTRRQDQWRCDIRRKAHPKQRFLKAPEVARLIHFVLYQDHGYLTGVVLRLNGGEHIKPAPWNDGWSNR